MSVRTNLCLAISTLALGLAATGCGSTSHVETKSQSPGQQLLQLDEAKQKGLISDREYERMRKKIVQEND